MRMSSVMTNQLFQTKIKIWGFLSDCNLLTTREMTARPDTETASRFGEPWTDEERKNISSWVLSLPEGYVLEGSDFDMKAKELQRTPGGIRAHVFANACLGYAGLGTSSHHLPNDELNSFVQYRAKTWHIPETDLLRFITKRQNEKKSGGTVVDYSTFSSEIAALHEKVDRLIICVSRLEAIVQKKHQ